MAATLFQIKAARAYMVRIHIIYNQSKLQMRDLFIDVETFSSVDIRTSGAYKYIESHDFEIILLSFAFDDEPIICIDLLSGQEMPNDFIEALFDETVIKHAHNATFERLCFKRIGFNVPIEQWECTAVKAAYCGLPFSLERVSEVLDLRVKKRDTGKMLIKYFSIPIKPTKINGNRTRNYPEHNPEFWDEYKLYNIDDVGAEREIHQTLIKYKLPEFDKNLYALDQIINDRGINADLFFAQNAVSIEDEFTNHVISDVRIRTGIENPKSPKQLKDWLFAMTGKTITAITKETIPILIKSFGANKDIKFVLDAREKVSKSSVKKYTSILNCAMDDSRIRGLFQYYGANRTGRWAGRLVQLQNLTKHHIPIDQLELAREFIYNNDADTLEMMFDDVNDILSQVLRTALIASHGNTFLVADFSAIEARVTSWLADEEWRLDVFRSHGKIYEAAAARMFNVPIEIVTKDSEYRARAKNAELALGYQGSLGAMKRMGGDKMGLSDAEMMSIVHKWRKANPKTVQMWNTLNDDAIMSVMYQMKVVSEIKGIEFNCDEYAFTITLPSGHILFYYKPRISENRFGTKCIVYQGVIQETKSWGEIETYGGKLTENIVQAISRDILGYSMMCIEDEGFPIVSHVHDEVIADVPDINTEERLKTMCDIMGEEIPWAKGLPLRAEGFVSSYYKKE